MPILQEFYFFALHLRYPNKKIFKSNSLIIFMNKGRKISGGRYVANRKKKLYEREGQARVVKLGEDKRRIKRTRGGNKKIFLLKAKFVNISGAGGQKKVEIKKVLETPSNRFLARQNVLTKGAIVETELGKVRITNRPSQEGVINGILVK